MWPAIGTGLFVLSDIVLKKYGPITTWPQWKRGLVALFFSVSMISLLIHAQEIHRYVYLKDHSTTEKYQFQNDATAVPPHG